MHAHIIYFNYLNPDGNGMSIGGIQTYIANLIPVLNECGYQVTVYQRSNLDFHKQLPNCDVFGIGHPRNHCPEVAKAILKKALSQIEIDKDLLIYGCETCITSSVPCRTIAIQHGILWDVPSSEHYSSIQYFKHYIGKCRAAWKIIQRVSKVDSLVCVDNNFINWHKAVTPYPKINHIVIPNFTEVPSEQPAKSNDMIHIIFARRFFIHRGTRLFGNVVVRLLNDYQNVKITIAGTGPDADYLHQQLDAFPQVCFTTFSSQDSLSIHKGMDIAVIPTIGSEGTSLSLLEAMASGCAPICTNVGGMTNIVLDGYNGLMITPNEEALYQALSTLINDAELRSKLQKNAYQTAKDAFSLTIWEKKWTKLIKQITPNS